MFQGGCGIDEPALVASRARSTENRSGFARMRALDMEQQQSHPVMTMTLLFIVVLLSLQFGVLYSELLGSSPKWTLEFTGPLRNIIDSFYTMFN